MSNFKSEFNKLNDNLKRNIYEYDPTFRNIFKNVLLELKTEHYKELINIMVNTPDFMFLDKFKVYVRKPRTTHILLYIYSTPIIRRRRQHIKRL